MKPYDERCWQTRLAHTDGYVCITLADGHYEAPVEFYAQLRNDLLNGVKEFLEFTTLTGDLITIRAEVVEALNKKNYASMLDDYEALCKQEFAE